MITVRINVVKIDKEKLFAGKNGAKYLDLVLIETKNSPYGDDYMVVQSATKEERAAGKRGAILGNAKILGRKNATQEESNGQPPPDDSEPVPF